MNNYTKVRISIILACVLCLVGCGNKQPAKTFPQAKQGTIHTTISHNGSIEEVTSEEAVSSNVTQYFTILDVDVPVPMGYEYSSTDNSFKLENKTSSGLIQGNLFETEVTVSGDSVSVNSTVDEVVDYIAESLFSISANNITVVDYGSSEKRSTYYVDTAYLSDGTVMEIMLGHGICLAMYTNNSEATMNNVVNDIINPQPKEIATNVKPTNYLKVIGGYYYSTKNIPAGNYKVYTLDDRGSTVQIFSKDKQQKYASLIADDSRVYTPSDTITLEESDVLYTSKDIALEKVK